MMKFVDRLKIEEAFSSLYLAIYIDDSQTLKRYGFFLIY